MFLDADTDLGDAIIKAVAGGVFLFMRSESISILGVIWAVLSLHEVAEEINEFRKTKKISFISGAGIVASLVLAVMLMMDPFGHFNTHVRILGIEILAFAFVRRKKGMISQS